MRTLQRTSRLAEYFSGKAKELGRLLDAKSVRYPTEKLYREMGERVLYPTVKLLNDLNSHDRR